MAKHKKPRTSSCFLGCFGISKVRDQTGSRSNSDKKKSQRWLPLPRAWSKKSGAKTVPVDLTAVVDDVAVADVESEKAEARRRYDESRLKSKSKARRSKSSPEKITGPKRRASEAAAATPAASEEYKPREVCYLSFACDCCELSCLETRCFEAVKRATEILKINK